MNHLRMTIITTACILSSTINAMDLPYLQEDVHHVSPRPIRKKESCFLSKDEVFQKIQSAVINGDIKSVKECLKMGFGKADIQQNLPLLIKAIECGHESIAILLIASGFSVFDSDSNGNTPLHIAAMVGSINLLKSINGFRPDIDAENNAGETPILCAAKNKKIEAMLFLMGMKANLKKTLEYLNTQEVLDEQQQDMLAKLVQNCQMRIRRGTSNEAKVPSVIIFRLISYEKNSRFSAFRPASEMPRIGSRIASSSTEASPRRLPLPLQLIASYLKNA